jgi:predicted naringenin-chalcone synthase
MQTDNVYLAEIQSIFPKQQTSQYIADRMYPSQSYGRDINHLAKKLAGKFGIEHRTTAIDYERWPESVELADPADHPRRWGGEIVKKLTTVVERDEIGLFALSYNTSFHSDMLPNLTSQIIMDTGLTGVEHAEEIAHYGCAAAIYVLQQAISYCRQYGKPALVFTFDQCSTLFRHLHKDDPDFKKMLIGNLLFTDGGVGVLVVPEAMRGRYRRPLLKVTGSQTKYVPGDLIGMRNGRFLMSSQVKDVMPKLVSHSLVKPLLNKHELDIDDIDEWSIHQGGSEVIKQFCREDCLQLSAQQIARSLELFGKYGNTSAASCLLVLDSFFNDQSTTKMPGSKGIMVGFGAGYYLGGLLYEWTSQSCREAA